MNSNYDENAFMDFTIDHGYCSDGDTESDYVSDSELEMKSEEDDRFHIPMVRQYTITCEQDWIDIQEGFCPKYATWWEYKHNRKHWLDESKIKYRKEYIRCFYENILDSPKTPPSQCVLSRSISDTNPIMTKKVSFNYVCEILIFDDNYFTPLVPVI